MRQRIVVVGSANTDMVVQIDHLPEPGETVLGGEYTQNLGGKGANQAVAAARLGADVTFVARLGEDTFGDVSIEAYKTEGIDTSYIVRDGKSPSGVALIMVDREAENIIAVAQGANANLSPEDVFAAEDAIQKADCLLVQLEIPLETVQAAIQLAVKHHVKVILNPAPAMGLPVDLLENVDYLTPNESEAALLTGERHAKYAMEGANLLKSRYKLKNLIITLAEKGAMIVGDHNLIVPAYPVMPVDTTGAGDAFNGALAVALARGESLVEAVKFANAVAALTTTRRGAQSSLPAKHAVETFIQENQDQMSFQGMD
jgi:ribokinase